MDSNSISAFRPAASGSPDGARSASRTQGQFFDDAVAPTAGVTIRVVPGLEGGTPSGIHTRRVGLALIEDTPN